MLLIHLDIWYSSPDNYGPAMHKAGEKTLLGNKQEILEQLARYADNVTPAMVNRTVNGITVNTTYRRVIQVSGYSARRGMYCDVL